MIVSNCPLRLSSLAGVCRDDLSATAAADGLARPHLRERLASVPDPRSLPGRRPPLEFVLALAVCAFTAAGHDFPSAIADWAAGCSQETLAKDNGDSQVICHRHAGARVGTYMPVRPMRGQDRFNGHGLCRLRGMVRYLKAA